MIKSNYIRSAEIKIANNPNMSEEEKYLLMQEARHKRMSLAVKLGAAQKVYISSADWSRGLRASTYTIDETDWTTYDQGVWRPTYTTTNGWYYNNAVFRRY